MQGADQIVMTFLRFIIERRAFLHGRRDGFGVHRFGRRHRPSRLSQREQITAIAIGHGAQSRPTIDGYR